MQTDMDHNQDQRKHTLRAQSVIVGRLRGIHHFVHGSLLEHALHLEQRKLELFCDDSFHFLHHVNSLHPSHLP